MATDGLAAPPPATLAIEAGQGVLEVRSTRVGRAKVRLVGLLVGALFAGLFGFPAWDMQDGLGLRLLLGGIASAGALFALWGLFRPIPRVHVRIRPESVEVLDGPEELVGTHPATRVVALIDTGGREDARPEEEASQVSGDRLIGLFLAGQGTLPLIHANAGGPARELIGQLQEVLQLASDPLPIWPSAPAVAGRADLEVLQDGAPAGWPEDGPARVTEAWARAVIEVPGPGPIRQVAGYTLAAWPFLLVTAGLVGLGLIGEVGGWAPWSMLVSGDALAAAMLGTWLAMGLWPTWRRVPGAHRLLSRGPYRLVIDGEHLTVQARGREVLDQVDIDEIRGLRVSRQAVAVLTDEDEIKLPLAGVVDGHDRAWVVQGLAYSVDRWGGHRLPDVAARAGTTTGPEPRASAVNADA